MYSLQIQKTSKSYSLQFRGNQNVLTSEYGHLRPALINFKHGIFPPFALAGTAYFAAAPGGAAAAAAAPSAGSIPPPLGAPPPARSPGRCSDAHHPVHRRAEARPAGAAEGHS